MTEFELRTEYITLGQILKVMGLAQTGGEAKMLLEMREITVNAEPENRRGRKLYPGDVVIIEGEEAVRILPPGGTVTEG